jgi:hypothetical protein
MTSYNPVNGVYTANSYDLIHNILRGEWGFKGYVMTDFEGWESQVKAQIIGNEWTTPGTAAERTEFQAAMANGTLPRSIMRANAAQMLEVLSRTTNGILAGGVIADDDLEISLTRPPEISRGFFNPRFHVKNSGTATNVSLIVAAYNANNQLIDVSRGTSITLPNGDAATFEASLLLSTAQDLPSMRQGYSAGAVRNRPYSFAKTFGQNGENKTGHLS